MCQRTDCPKCGRPTYRGCGAHVEQVLGGVAPENRCQCREKEARSETRKTAVGNERRPWLRGLFGE